MTIRDVKGTVDDRIPVKNVLVSVYDKAGLLDELVPELMDVNPDVRFISTGGTYTKLKGMIGKKNLISVEEYTSLPEMEGGLVKTLHPKIHAGILGERHNVEHQRYLADALGGAAYIDMVVVNLYPFEDVIYPAGVTFEKARGNIDIGGPTMLRAAAKNFLSCAAVCDPHDYDEVIATIKQNDGCTTFEQRLHLATNVFQLMAEYDDVVAGFIRLNIETAPEKIRACYGLGGE